MRILSRSLDTKAILFLLVLCALGIFPAASQAAIRVEKLESVEFKQDFVVGPAKTELTLNPGESVSVDLLVTNRTSEERRFNLEIEDITGSRSTEQVVNLLGSERGPYSLRDYIKLDSNSFILKSGERAWVPVTVAVPTDAEAGGKYGSVIVSTTGVNDSGSGSGVAGGAVLVSRVGSLFFVTVPGDVKKEGELKGFSITDGKKIRGQGPIEFDILYENNGTIHLNPSGEISITNIMGQKVAFIELNSWFSLPNSLRLRQVPWDPPFLMGRYTAHLTLKRGYGDLVDTANVSFYVIPWLLIISIAALLCFLFLFLRWVVSKFEIRRR